MQDEPLVIWLLGGGDKQLNGDQFMLQNNYTYRTREAHQNLQEACTYQGDESLADMAYEVNHAASIMAKEHNAVKRPQRPV